MTIPVPESPIVTVPPPDDHIPLSLALAVVASSQAPILLLDGDLAVISVSTSFCQAFGIDPATVPGREIFEIGTGEWNVPQLRSLLEMTLSEASLISSYEMELKQSGQPPRRLALKAEKFRGENGFSGDVRRR